MRIPGILLCVAIVCTCSSGASPQTPRNSAPVEGLLLGLATGTADPDAPFDSPQLQKFATAWIVRDGKTAHLVAILPELFVPRAPGFWRIGMENVCEMYGEHHEFRSNRAIVWSAPADSTPQLTKGPACPVKSVNPNAEDSNDDDSQENSGENVDRYTDCMFSTRSIDFVSPNFISENAVEGNTEYCEARGGRWQAWSRVVSITTPEIKEMTELKNDGSTFFTNAPVSKKFADFFDENPKQIQGVFDAVYAKEAKALAAQDCPDGQPDYLGWRIKRENGTWMPFMSQQIFLGDSMCEIDERIPVDLPVALTGNDRLAGFDELKRTIPDLTDAFRSPSGNTEIVLTGSKIIVFDLSGHGLGAKLLEVDAPKHARTVMDQWAQGSHVQSWTLHITGWKSHPPAVPVISTK